MQQYASESNDFFDRIATGEHYQPSPPPSPPSTPRLTTNLSYSTVHTARTSSVQSQEDFMGTAAEDGEDMRSGGAYWALVGGYGHPQPGSRLLQYGKFYQDL